MATVKRIAVIYFCDGVCSVDTRKKHMKKNNLVYLVADGTDVHLKFRDDLSPFKSGDFDISIPAGGFVLEEVKAFRVKKEFPYELTCPGPGGCPSQTDDPSFIVDL